ncbi:response regulator transcription factor [Clostridium sp. D2Q-11]|uniref:Response regulator transcription factor n=1 Tax=Anaeromonas frigoriresistens TaxID=2683708 RepID=A0A942UVY4_9FIRM|nr:LytTR family DNA-binding domain-containing protein [Anaeromonas frigoriresistens]MBS4539055.1 response regulator transcription factor [Anaeromonas frigoriresistens]
MGKIIIVEDDVAIRDGLKFMVKDMDKDLEVITTGFATKALDYSKKNKIDAFFLDIQLEDYSGIKLAKEIREISTYKFTPIVFITAVPTRELEAFREVHCYDYIIKPFTKEEVKDVLSTIINYSVKNKEKNKSIRFKQKEYTCVIGQADIKYIESKNRKLFIETKEEQFVISTYTLKSVLEELSSDFIRCHKGFIVNTNFIKKIDKNNKLIYLKDTANPISIGRKYKENLQGDLI